MATTARGAEASSMSKSISTVAEQQTKLDIINGKSGPLDRLFPLFDEIQKQTDIPKILYYIVLGYVIFQVIGVSMWVMVNRNNHRTDFWTKILLTWTQIAYLTDHSGNISDVIIAFSMISVFVFVFIFGIAIQMVIFKNERRFIKWTLYLTRIVIEFLPTICMIPIGYGIGSYIDIIINNPSTTIYIILAITVLYVPIYIFDQSIQSKIFNFNVYISKSIFVSWDPRTHLTYITISAIFPCLNFILMEFEFWTQALCIAFKIAFNIYMVYHFSQFPLLSVRLNAISAALFTTMCFMDAVQIIRCFWISVSNMWVTIALIAGIIIFTILYDYLFTLYAKKISKKLTIEALQNFVAENEDLLEPPPAAPPHGIVLTDAGKRALYQSYGLDRSLAQCYRYLRIGIAFQCPLFLDWSLLKYVAEFHSDKQMLLTLCQYLCFFPSETRMMNIFFNQAIGRHDLNYSDRFLLYQIHRVKGLRQSSASAEITEKLLEMKNMSMDGIQTARNFWINLPDNISYLYDIRKLTISLTGMFNEAIEKWPNNIRICEEYSTFLVEGASDFVGGLKIKYRSDMIEQEKNFAIDLPFRSLVRKYPNYLKKYILDVKGNFIKQKNHGNQKGGGSKSMSISISNNGSQNSSVSTINTANDELDAEVEEQLGRGAFSYPRLRLAFQRSLHGRKSQNNEKLKIVSYWTVLMTVICLVILYAYYYNKYENRITNIERQVLLNNFRFGFDCAITVLTTYWVQGLKNGNGSSLIGEQLWDDMRNRVNPKQNINNLDIQNHTLQQEANRWVAYARDNLENFTNEVIELAIDGTRIDVLMKEMYYNMIPFIFCDSNGDIINNSAGQPAAVMQNDLKSISAYFFLKLRGLTMDEYNDTTQWDDNKDVCEVHVNAQTALSAFNNLEESVSKDMEVITAQTRKENFMLMGILVCVFFVLTEPLLFYYLTNTFRELNHLIKLMHSLNESIKKEASRPMKADAVTQTDAFHREAKGHSIRKSIFYAMIVVPVIIGCGVVVIVVLLAEKHNQMFLKLNEWLFYGLMRGSYMHESFHYTMTAMAINQGAMNPSYLNETEAIKIAMKSAQTLVYYNNVLLRGTATLTPCIGLDEMLDQIHTMNDCHSLEDQGNLHDVYRCSSLDRSVALFSTFVNDILVDINESQFAPDSLFYHMFHISNYHMIDLTFEAAGILANLASSELSAVREQLAYLCIGSLSILIVGFLTFMLLLDRLQVAFDGAMQMMLRLPPLSITQNQGLFNFLMHKECEKSNTKMSTANSVVHLANDAIFFLNRQESIEVVNRAVPTILGYTPEQLLGQPFSTVITIENGPKVYETFTMMRNGQSSLIVEQSCTATTDSDQLMPVNATILAITEGSTDIAKSFVVILRDESTIIEVRKKAESAKEAAEKLLYQILPRDIVTRLNRGESDISIVVPSGTVIFIDIQKFSEYAANLVPSQIMENLSLIFDRFDEIIAKYPLLMKIKLIGDVYMAAGGLFSPEEPPSSHAQQMVQFALDVLQALEDVNSQLNSSLQVRIGINTDGPLYAGVLGTDKPVFDIIGDTINVAARLQSNGIAGTVQISESTYNAIKDLNFQIEQRGMLELKGKGKRMAYIVRGINTGSFFRESGSQG